jgi:methyl-accepting chemotaxis protein WspA
MKMFKDMKIGVRLGLGFGLVLMLMGVMIAVGMSRLTQMSETISRITKQDWVKAELTYAVEQGVRENAELNLEMLLTTDSAKVENIRATISANRSRITQALTTLEPMLRRPEGKAMFARITAIRGQYVATFEKMGSLVAEDKREAATHIALTEMLPVLKELLVPTRELVEFQKSLVDADALVADAQAVSGRNLMVGLGSVTFLICIVFAWFITRSITQPMAQAVDAVDRIGHGNLNSRMDFESGNELGLLARGFNQMTKTLSTLVSQVQTSGVQVSSSITEIAATAKEQQATASEIAATTTEIGATSREISATSKELVNTMNEVSTVAEQTAGLASNGQAGLARMETTMKQVTEAAASINAKLVVLNEKASKINQVVTTITKVADQTNLLSLNAAIEAEKAGEAGRGFAVVATEIRRLADQTGVATYDIEQTVKEIQSAVAAGVMGMDKFSEEVRRGMHEVQQVGEQLSQIIHQVQTLAPRCVAVSEGMQAQATGAEQISDALAQLTEASQQTVESLGQSNEAIGGLSDVSTGLRDSVSRFTLQAA